MSPTGPGPHHPLDDSPDYSIPPAPWTPTLCTQRKVGTEGVSCTQPYGHVVDGTPGNWHTNGQESWLGDESEPGWADKQLAQNREERARLLPAWELRQALEYGKRHGSET